MYTSAYMFVHEQQRAAERNLHLHKSRIAFGIQMFPEVRCAFISRSQFWNVSHQPLQRLHVRMSVHTYIVCIMYGCFDSYGAHSIVGGVPTHDRFGHNRCWAYSVHSVCVGLSVCVHVRVSLHDPSVRRIINWIKPKTGRQLHSTALSHTVSHIACSSGYGVCGVVYTHSCGFSSQLRCEWLNTQHHSRNGHDYVDRPTNNNRSYLSFIHRPTPLPPTIAIVVHTKSSRKL